MKCDSAVVSEKVTKILNMIDRFARGKILTKTVNLRKRILCSAIIFARCSLLRQKIPCLYGVSCIVQTKTHFFTMFSITVFSDGNFHSNYIAEHERIIMKNHIKAVYNSVSLWIGENAAN